MIIFHCVWLKSHWVIELDFWSLTRKKLENYPQLSFNYMWRTKAVKIFLFTLNFSLFFAIESKLEWIFWCCKYYINRKKLKACQKKNWTSCFLPFSKWKQNKEIHFYEKLMQYKKNTNYGAFQIDDQRITREKIVWIKRPFLIEPNSKA